MLAVRQTPQHCAARGIGEGVKDTVEAVGLQFNHMVECNGSSSIIQPFS
jgi:hypothetical protein